MTFIWNRNTFFHQCFKTNKQKKNKHRTTNWHQHTNVVFVHIKNLLSAQKHYRIVSYRKKVIAIV